MTESDFNRRVEKIFACIEQAVDGAEADIGCSVQEGIMELEFGDGSKIIINRHSPNREIWVAAKSGGFHYGWNGQTWINTRDGSELLSALRNLIRQQGGGDVFFSEDG